MKRNIALTLLLIVALLGSPQAIAQASGGGTYIDGSLNPSGIPDSVAYRVVYLSLALPSNPTQQDYNNQLVLIQQVGLSGTDIATMQQAVANYLAQYQQAGSTMASANASSPSDSNAVTFQNTIDTDTTNTTNSLSTSLSAAGYSALQAFVQSAKTGVKYWSNSSYYSDSYVDGTTTEPHPNFLFDLQGGLFVTTGVEGTSHLINCEDEVVLTASFNGGNVWNAVVSGVAMPNITTASDGTVLGLKNGAIYGLIEGWKTWQPTLTNYTFSQISAGSTNLIFGLDANGYVYQYQPSSNTFSYINGRLNQISAASDGTAWGVINGAVYRWNNPGWQGMPGPGNFKQISASSKNGAVAVDANGHAWTWYAPLNKWLAVSGNGILTKVSYGVDGTLYGIAPGGSVWYHNAPLGVWQQLPNASATDISVAGANDIWVSGSGGQVYRYFPNTTAKLDTTPPPGQPYNYFLTTSAEGFAPSVQVNEPSTAQVNNPCYGQLLNASYMPHAVLAYVMGQYTGGPGQNCGPTRMTLCDWPINWHCTPATTPPFPWHPYAVTDDETYMGPQGTLPFFGWDAHGLCAKIDGVTDWHCAPAQVNPATRLWGTIYSIPLQECTKLD